MRITLFLAVKMLRIPHSLLLLCTFYSYGFSYRFGIGIFDITGPAAEVNMMGYAKLAQNTEGIHTRLFSRAYIISDDTSQARPILFISLDIGMTSQLLKTTVVNKLIGKYGDEFSHENVLLSATHTHSGPGGYFEYFLYSITSLGLVQENFDVMVRGIIESVSLAKANMVNGKILINEGDLYDASINRSPASYLLNPKEERDNYAHNVDTKMTLLKFVDAHGRAVGMLNWFAVHATSMNNSNRLISGDNKGLASQMFEERMNGHRHAGQGPFVAAFAQANEGDVSPNINGPKCIDTGEPCDFIQSTCNGHADKCIAFGPGSDMFESTKIIAQRQMEMAWYLFETAREELSGAVKFVHQFVNMTDIRLNYNGKSVSTCKPAMGYSFAGGTMDGPGDFDFTQGTTEGTKFWDFVRNLIKEPSQDLINCHHPKPILIASGEVDRPFAWQPVVVAGQILRVGQLSIVGLPGEFTTMSGRRIRKTVEKSLQCPAERGKFWKCGGTSYTVLAGLSNVYTSYIATPEEYQLQRYEGASTIYGPYTLPAYVELFERLARALQEGQTLPPGPNPPYFPEKTVEFLLPVLFDTAGIGRKFGQVLVEPEEIYERPGDVVVVRFVSANPRNNVMQNGTFLTVDRYADDSQTWVTEFTDANWETKFHWSRPWPFGSLIGQSEAEISWQVTTWDGVCRPGIYRIRHNGVAKSLSLFGTHMHPFSGTSKTFRVTCGNSAAV